MAQIFLNFVTGYEEREPRVTVVDLKKIRRNYLRGFFAIDFDSFFVGCALIRDHLDFIAASIRAFYWVDRNSCLNEFVTTVVATSARHGSLVAGL